MKDRRKAKSEFRAIDEDMGIFKRGVVDVRLHLTPLRRQSSRDDFICVGLVQDAEVEVVFPGRRKGMTGPLENQLIAIKKEAKASALPSIPVRARGTWRTRIIELDDLERQRVYQFLVSEWTIPGPNGAEVTYGEQPKL